MVASLLLGAISASAGAPPDRYPKEAWSIVDPGLLGWSPEKLAAVRKFVETLPPSSVVVIDQRIGMQDFQVDDMYYLHAPADASPDFDKSTHPAYHFRMTARDLARFGYLFLRNGEWRGKPVVPKTWVSESTEAHSHTKAGEGYRDLVVVYLNHTEFPDDASGLTVDAVKKLPSISHEQVGEFFKMLLDAQTRSPI